MKDLMQRPAVFLLIATLVGVACDKSATPGPAAEQAVMIKSGAAPSAVPAPRPTQAATPPAGPVLEEAIPKEKIRRLCKTVCDTTSSMPCVEIARCTDACVESFSQPFCAPEFEAMLTCSASSPVTQFECGEEGAPILKEEACQLEQERAAHCVMAIMQKGAGTVNQ